MLKALRGTTVATLRSAGRQAVLAEALAEPSPNTVHVLDFLFQEGQIGPRRRDNALKPIPATEAVL